MKSLEVLIVDDSKKDRVLLMDQLAILQSAKGYRLNICQVNSPQKALLEINTNKYDLVFLDFLMNDGDGMELLMSLAPEQKYNTNIVFLTGFGNSMIREDSISIGASAYLDKININTDSLNELVSAAI